MEAVARRRVLVWAATSSQVVYDYLVIHRHQLAAASSGVTSFSMTAICEVLSDSALR
jgi:SpoU rRNA methylase family enzyme